jgi:large subunit ribosomal protein L4
MATTTPLNLTVFNAQGQSVGAVEIDPAELGGKINKQLLHEVVLMYQANARVGTRRSNKRRGGGTAKGPKPRDYSYQLPKKAVRAATKMALLSKLQDNETVVVDGLQLGEIKTKQMAEVLKALNLGGVTCLVGLGKTDIDEKQTVYKSARNIRGIEVSPATQFNAYGILKPKRLLLTKAALGELCKGAKWK